jgi:nitrate/nitrite transport system ATP-binding protein
LADRIIPLNPDGTLGDEVRVSIPRPRDRMAMNHDETFKQLRMQVTNYLMDVGIEAKVEGTRQLPNVTPIHGVPTVVKDAQEGLIEERFLDFSQLHKIYPTPKGPLTVVEDFDLKVNRGEFISLIGHSGCGKSTVLTMAAGLNDISKGAIKLDGRHVEGADPERAVVFQSPNLFPWLTAKENVAIGVDKVYPRASQAERQDVVEYYLERVGLADAMDKEASSMSNGMKQRVGIARAFALSPKLLLLDEPFGMLDSLTRWELQEVLMEVWSRTKVTAICVTHDVDEAILLADRVVMMTNGPQATIGKIVDVDLPRPRTRKALLEHPDYYTYRQEVLDFLEEYEHGAKPKPKAPKAIAAE